MQENSKIKTMSKEYSAHLKLYENGRESCKGPVFDWYIVQDGLTSPSFGFQSWNKISLLKQIT